MVAGQVGSRDEAPVGGADRRCPPAHEGVAVDRPPARGAGAPVERFAHHEVGARAGRAQGLGRQRQGGRDNEEVEAGGQADGAAAGRAGGPPHGVERRDRARARGRSPGAGLGAVPAAAGKEQGRAGPDDTDLAGIARDVEVGPGRPQLDQKASGKEGKAEEPRPPGEQAGGKAPRDEEAIGQRRDRRNGDPGPGKGCHALREPGKGREAGSQRGGGEAPEPKRACHQMEGKARHQDEAGERDGKAVGEHAPGAGTTEMGKGDWHEHEFDRKRRDEEGGKTLEEPPDGPLLGRPEEPLEAGVAGEQKQGEDGRKTELEARREEHLGPGEEEERGRQREEPEREGIAPEGDREHHDRDHDPGTHRRHLGAGQPHIGPGDEGGRKGCERPERQAQRKRHREKEGQAPDEEEGAARDHADVKARDGDEVGKAGDRDRLAQRLGDPAPRAGHEGRGERPELGPERAGEEAVDRGARAGKRLGEERWGRWREEGGRARRAAARRHALEPGAARAIEPARDERPATALEHRRDSNPSTGREAQWCRVGKGDRNPEPTGIGEEEEPGRLAAAPGPHRLDRAAHLGGREAMVENRSCHLLAAEIGDEEPERDQERAATHGRAGPPGTGKAEEAESERGEERGPALADERKPEPEGDAGPDENGHEERPLRPLRLEARAQAVGELPPGSRAFRLAPILQRAGRACRHGSAIGPTRTPHTERAPMPASTAPASLSPPVVRFAPSPTGELHIGGARTALFNFLFARHHGGTFLLRIEDTDRARSTGAAIGAILDGLAWLGLEPDRPVVFQSERQARHAEVAHALLAQGGAYRCYLTAAEIEAARARQLAEGRSARLESPWRDRTDGPEDRPFAIRLRAPRDGETVVEDAVQGRIVFPNADLDDFVLLRSDGTPTYMLAVVVDDHDMGVTHVIRGDDHLPNTPRQLALIRALGWPVPTYAHLPMIHGADGTKLSKRHGAVGVAAYRDELGILPEALENHLLRLGWAHGDTEILSREEAIRLFDLGGVGRSPARFDLKKLESLNAHYLRAADDARLAALVAGRLEAGPGASLGADARRILLRSMAELKTRARNLNQLAESARPLLGPRPISMDAGAARLLDGRGREILGRARAVLEEVEPFERAGLEAAARALAGELGVGLGEVAGPIRAALTGTTASPSVFWILEILGRDEGLGRLQDAIGTMESTA